MPVYDPEDPTSRMAGKRVIIAVVVVIVVIVLWNTFVAGRVL